MLEHDRLSESFSRTALALVHSGEATSLEAARSTLDQYRIAIHAGGDVCTSPEGQAAILTAVATASRAVGHVPVTLAAPDTAVLRGPYRGQLLGQAVASASPTGVQVNVPTAQPENSQAVDVIIGEADPPPRSDTPVLRASWDGWRFASGGTVVLPCRGHHPLAAIAAAATAISHAFAVLCGRPGAVHRDCVLSLWNPLDPADVAEPELRYLCPAWHLVGLGHLGQAAAWCLAYLPFQKDNMEVVVQDLDRLTPANVSTSVLTRPTDINRLKTRVVATHLEAAGITTRILERRLTSAHRRSSDEPSLALIGVDNLAARRLISDVGWELAIDMGLGRGSRDYTTISLHTLDHDHRVDDIAAWNPRLSTDPSTKLPDLPAYRAATRNGHDQCGLVQLATRAVGACFVGTVAACFAITEPLRRLAEGIALQAICIDLQRPSDMLGAPTDTGPMLLSTPSAQETSEQTKN